MQLSDAQGAFIPPIGTLVSAWFPFGDKPVVTAMWSGGFQLGSLFSFPLGSAFCKLALAGGWPLIFYFCALLGLVWLIVFVVFASDSPQHNRFIADAEKQFIAREVNCFRARGTVGKAIE